MSQNRKPPAYQEYAASMLAHLKFRTMTLQERGLLYTMRLECWENERLPSTPHKLAKVLGMPAAEVASSLQSVMPFFDEKNGLITCPELDNYREHLEMRRVKQSEGGKRGSVITNGHRSIPKKNSNPNGSSTPSSNSKPPRRDSRDSLVQSNSEKQSQNQSSEGPVDVDPFIAEMEEAELRLGESYFTASRGG